VDTTVSEVMKREGKIVTPSIAEGVLFSNIVVGG
jgi:hypothetical protein